MKSANKPIDAICGEFPKVFPGFSCRHVPGSDPGFKFGGEGFVVYLKAKRIGTFLLTEELLDDVPTKEILSRLKADQLINNLSRDGIVNFGTSGYVSG